MLYSMQSTTQHTPRGREACDSETLRVRRKNARPGGQQQATETSCSPATWHNKASAQQQPMLRGQATASHVDMQG
eukprot:266319-Lingulodinium_polyedra.AAC.1